MLAAAARHDLPWLVLMTAALALRTLVVAPSRRPSRKRAFNAP
jgi:hypothetical protein